MPDPSSHDVFSTALAEAWTSVDGVLIGVRPAHGGGGITVIVQAEEKVGGDHAVVTVFHRAKFKLGEHGLEQMLTLRKIDVVPLMQGALSATDFRIPFDDVSLVRVELMQAIACREAVMIQGLLYRNRFESGERRRYIISEDGKSIRCGRCGLVSHNANDVVNRYCGNCGIFHDDQPGAA